MTDARTPSPALVAAFARCRARDLGGAVALLEQAIGAGDDDPALPALAGLLLCQLDRPAEAVPHLRRAHAALPGDTATRNNLATALLQTRAFAEAADIAAGSDDPKLLRIHAYAMQLLERPGDAARSYERIVAADPRDFESWNNLGNVRLACDDTDGAVAALERAAALKPDAVPIRINLAKALAKAERHEEQRAVMVAAAALAPDDPEVLTELALAEGAVRDHDASERAFRTAIARDPSHLPAYVELGTLLESLNRIDALAALAAEAQARGLPAGEVAFMQAWALRRQNRFADALPLAERAAESIDPIRRSQLIAQIADRLGDTDRAFAAYAEMNRLSVAKRPHAIAHGAVYRDEIAGMARQLTRATAWRWTTAAAGRTAPVCIVGFPRSGTTLLDTLLMNMPTLAVLEEKPALDAAERAAGDMGRIAGWDAATIARGRDAYFAAARELDADADTHVVVDKHPLHMARMPVIHRLFPDARIVFVERHPCDVVLSCFMANFQLNHGMANMTTLADAARLYDLAQRSWTNAVDLLPLKVHRIRYERMVADLEGEMRPLLAFLGLDWDPAVLDNQGSAARRAHIPTASYAQVTEPIYQRSSGRWQRYRTYLEPVLPVLAPWAEAMGYAI